MTFEFVHRQNIKHFRKQLAAAADEPSRTLLEKLLNEELAKDSPTREPYKGEDAPSREC